MIGRVYKIIVNCSNEIYVGSTFQECRARWQDHKALYNCPTKKSNTSSFVLFDKYGINNCKIILIKEYEVFDKQHLRAYEQLWINKLKPINCNSSFALCKVLPIYHKQKYQKRLDKDPEYLKKLYQQRKQKNPSISKDIYEKYKENILEQAKIKYQKQLQNNPNRNKERYVKEKEQKLSKIQCECGVYVCKVYSLEHKKSKKHINLMSSIQLT